MGERKGERKGNYDRVVSPNIVSVSCEGALSQLMFDDVCDVVIPRHLVAIQCQS